MKAPFSYFGSKNRLAPWVIEQMSSHKHYVEPFAGSAAVLFAKEPSRKEVINDANGEVVNFFRVLRDTPDDLIEALTLTPYARDEYYAARSDGDASTVERARRFMVAACMGFNGEVTAPDRAPVGFSFTSGRQTSAKAPTFARRVDRLEAVAQRLRHVEIENVDYRVLLDRWDYPETTVYADPPYLGETRHSGGYINDGREAQFHKDLLTRLDAFSGEVVLSGYPSSLYAEILTAPRWTILTRDVYAPSGNSAETRRVESLWVKRAAV